MVVRIFRTRRNVGFTLSVQEPDDALIVLLRRYFNEDSGINAELSEYNTGNAFDCIEDT